MILGNEDYGGPAQEVPEGTLLATGIETIFVIFWQRTWLAAFCLCPKPLPEAKFEKFHLQWGVHENLILTLSMQIYSGKKKQVGQKEV